MPCIHPASAPAATPASPSAQRAQFTGQNAKFSGPPGGTARTWPAALRHRLVAGYVTGQ
jgi:hypothetical protein